MHPLDRPLLPLDKVPYPYTRPLEPVGGYPRKYLAPLWLRWKMRRWNRIIDNQWRVHNIMIWDTPRAIKRYRETIPADARFSREDLPDNVLYRNVPIVSIRKANHG